MHLRMVLASGAILFALAAIPSSDATAQAVISARTADQMGLRPAKQYREAKVVKVASAKQPGSCGTYMYSKKGKCTDARDKK